MTSGQKLPVNDPSVSKASAASLPTVLMIVVMASLLR
jgi:hypothetical protein